MNILKLPNKVNKLNAKDKALFNRFFEYDLSVGTLNPTSQMIDWIRKTFGNIEKVKNQKILNIINKFTFEGALYNELRALRPMGSKQEIILDEFKQNDVLADPWHTTPEDSFGRIRNFHDVSASNIAKYDTNHGLIIFNKFSPLLVTREELGNHFQTAMHWFNKAHEIDNKGVYPILLWNCLFKSGASLAHGHMQTLLSHSPYGRLRRKNEIIAEYKRKYKTNYFNDLFKIHEKLGLAFNHNNVKIFVSLTPAKEKETVIISDSLNKETIDSVFNVVEAFKNMGVQSFNMFAILEPYIKWNLPIVIKLVDRGSLSNKTTDVGALELFTQQAVISSDPYKVFKEVKKRFL